VTAPRPTPRARRAGQIAGLALVLATMLLVARCIRLDGPAPDLTPGELVLDALDRSDRACVTADDVLAIVTANRLRATENPPLACTDAPPDASWLAVTAEDRTRFYAFGSDGCRIPVTEATCP
jgi:hypothetical protein